MLALFIAAAMPGFVPAQGFLPAVHFPDDPENYYVPVRATAEALAMKCTFEKNKIFLDDQRVNDIRELGDGTKLMPVNELSRWKAQVAWDPVLETASIDLNGRHVSAHKGPKRVEISKKAQELRAYEGDLLVLETHVSTGRKGHGTPSGDFAAARKERMHYSHIYDDSPMPWAVQVDGNVFIHGFTSVPKYPASHGCIRVPLRGNNPARWFYHWVEIGTPVSIGYDWPDAAASASVNVAEKTSKR